MPSKAEPENSILLALTWKCDLRCKSCIYEGLLGKGEMPMGLVQKVARHIEPHHTIIVAGGEPTLHKQFWPIIQTIAAKKPAHIVILTNGNSFTKIPAQARDFFKRLGQASVMSGTNITVRVSVGDFHLDLRKGKPRKRAVEEARERVRVLRENAPTAGRVHLDFCAAHAKGQSEQALLKKYGLPREAYVTRVIEWDPKHPGGTMPRTFITPEGGVFRSEQAMKQGKRLGNLKRESLPRIWKRLRRPK